MWVETKLRSTVLWLLIAVLPRDGRFIEMIGNYDPTANPKKFEFDAERVAYWLKVGAQPTVTVKNLLKQDRFFEKDGRC